MRSFRDSSCGEGHLPRRRATSDGCHAGCGCRSGSSQNGRSQGVSSTLRSWLRCAQPISGAMAKQRGVQLCRDKPAAHGREHHGASGKGQGLIWPSWPSARQQGLVAARGMCACGMRSICAAAVRLAARRLPDESVLQMGCSARVGSAQAQRAWQGGAAGGETRACLALTSGAGQRGRQHGEPDWRSAAVLDGARHAAGTEGVPSAKGAHAAHDSQRAAVLSLPGSAATTHLQLSAAPARLHAASTVPAMTGLTSPARVLIRGQKERGPAPPMPAALPLLHSLCCISNLLHLPRVHTSARPFACTTTLPDAPPPPDVLVLTVSLSLLILCAARLLATCFFPHSTAVVSLPANRRAPGPWLALAVLHTRSFPPPPSLLPGLL